MKKFLIMAVCAQALLCACNSNTEIFEEDRTDIQRPDTLWYEVTNVTRLTLDAFSDSLVKAQPGLQGSVATVKGMLTAQLGESQSQFSVLNVTYNYKSRGKGGKTTTLSGMLTIPSVQGLLLKQKLVVDNRGTQTGNADAPTLHWNSGIIMALTGVPVVTADLLGYGASLSEPLNYCCYHMAGKSIADGVAVAQQMLHSQWVNHVVYNEPLPIYNVGYSQGGYDAMALQRYIETEATQAEKALLPLKKTYCGDGPYVLQAMMDVTEALPVYMYTPFLISGIMSTMNYHPECYPEGTKIQDVLNPAVAQSGLVQMLEAKSHSSATTIGLYAQAVGGYKPISAAFIPEVLDHSEAWYANIHKALEVEDITDGWKPVAPIWMYHATNDDCVPVECSRRAAAAFAGCPDVTYVEDPSFPAGFGVHSSAGAKFMMAVLQMGWE